MELIKNNRYFYFLDSLVFAVQNRHITIFRGMYMIKKASLLASLFFLLISSYVGAQDANSALLVRDQKYILKTHSRGFINLDDGKEYSAGMDSTIIVDDIKPDESVYIIRFDKLTKPGPTMPIQKAIDKGARYSIAFDIICTTMVTPTGWRAAAGVLAVPFKLVFKESDSSPLTLSPGGSLGLYFGRAYCLGVDSLISFVATAGVGEISVGTTDVFLAGGPIYSYKSMQGGIVVGYNFIEVRFWFSLATGFSFLN
jgi:hypothetical protein